ncbi:MAG: hypothetical protein OXE57_13670 [Alphaproteobacteria bacterium]|nr:hypothetical protein [Alphaproteobacteria bacterium]
MVEDLRGKTAVRALDKQFVGDLENGLLAPVAEAVRSDSTLCLELRGTYINVYYRGGKLMEIAKASCGYRPKFDKNYFGGEKKKKIEAPTFLTQPEHVDNWLEVWPWLKRAMDRYLAGTKGSYEREFQQLFVRDNNCGRIKRGAKQSIEYKDGSIARSTDYYICDLEYTRSGESWQFDMIAVHWPSDRQQRKISDNRRLAIVEVKYGDNALDDPAGLVEHIKDVNSFLGNPDKVDDLKKDMVRVFNQKRQLGLMDCRRDLKSFSDERPILLLALVNHDPDSTKLRNILGKLPESPNADLRLGTASFFGYGLYDQGVHTVDEMHTRFGEYIYNSLGNNIRK